MMSPEQQTIRRPSPNNPFLTLRKILELDRQRYAFADKAVTGGLTRYVDHWLAQAREALPSPPPRWMETLAELLRSYSAADVPRRQQIVELSLRYLGQVEALDQAGPSSPAEQERPAAAPAPPAPAGPAAPSDKPAFRDEAAPAPATISARPSTRSIARPAAHSTAHPYASVSRPAASIQGIPGIGPAYARLLAKLEVFTVHDLLFHLPRRYIDYRDIRRIQDLAEGVVQSVLVTVWETHAERTLSGKKRVVATVGDQTGTMEAIWWNQDYLVDRLTPGRQIVLSGVPSVYRGRLQFQPSDWEFLERGELVNTARMVPVHPLTEGLTGPWLRRKIKETIDQYTSQLADPIPEDIRREAALMPLARAVEQVHFPDSPADLKAARRRLAFEELLLVQLGLLRRRREWQNARAGVAIRHQPEAVEEFLASLPFSPTSAQRRVIGEILADMQQPVPMMRLLQGDVGSGKTMVATIAMVLAAANGFQSVLMAPTEVLAEQHYRTLSEMLGRLDDGSLSGGPVLLTGSVTGSARAQAYEAIAGGQAKVVVGTQALIQDNVEFQRLGLAIVDEQHRFGVNQRSALCQKGHNPHLLVMTATPIPRTLSLTIYGDLDVSIIDELPPGRQEIETLWFRPEQRRTAYGLVRRDVEQGHQAFVVCPLIEESEALEAKAAATEYKRLQKEVFPDLRLGLLHGRMKSKEKEGVMARFRDGKLDVLVSTPVIEVGIDVPNATIMMVEGADRFGLAQLHQFRGRVGRGPAKSRCLLLADTYSFEGGQRLQAIVNTTDGFKLAETDLEMRGPGEFLGTRQSGLPDLKVATFGDRRTLEEARQAAQHLFERDPELQSPGHRLLAQRLDAFWQKVTETATDGA
ncbi:MAG: ATP-dependent DNA helicase RecG [Bacteroidetes bacterium]|nr:ATP-dependent DNA helicase RecG [Bacteroidota bacterium]MCL5026796.1 ATP-dependent DNA helicase RecG [Chloroflexota bacterium]